jgi:protease YdgD
MRFSIVAAAALALVCLGSLSAATPAARHSLGFSPMPKGGSAAKPPAAAGAAGAAEDDSCRWANDHECDEPGLGTGACPAGTDRTDCIRIRSGVEDDSCQWAHDGECDEPGFGTGACTQGTDHTDCGAISWMRFQNDSCATAFDGVCDEPGVGTGHCGAHTDRRDCFGSKRPLNINDHFFGNDDRVFVDRTAAPWRSVGRLRTPDGGVCTATLIAPNVLITAAHCIYTGERVNVAGTTFETAQGFAGGPYQANVIGYWTDPRFDYHRFTTTNDIDGMDWTLLRLDQPLGDRVGYLGVFDLTELGQERTHAREIFHAGYSWDLQGHLGAHLGCHIATVYPDNTFAHECDTTRGDSGSPFMVRDGETYRVIGTDSNFRTNPHGPALYIAVSENAWARYLGPFTAGRLGHAVAAPGKGRERP